jgi:hypothetical protein
MVHCWVAAYLSKLALVSVFSKFFQDPFSLRVLMEDSLLPSSFRGRRFKAAEW